MSRFVSGLFLVLVGFVVGYLLRPDAEIRPAKELITESVPEQPSPTSTLHLKDQAPVASKLPPTTTTVLELAAVEMIPTVPETTTTSLPEAKEVGANSFRPWIDPQQAYRQWKDRPTSEIIQNSRSILGYSLKPGFVRHFAGTFEGQFTANDKSYVLRVEMGWSQASQIQSACVGIFSPEKRVVFGSLGTSDLNIFQSKEAKSMLILDLPKTYAVELYLKQPGEFSVLLSFITNKIKGSKTEVRLRELQGKRNPRYDGCKGHSYRF